MSQIQLATLALKGALKTCLDQREMDGQSALLRSLCSDQPHGLHGHYQGILCNKRSIVTNGIPGVSHAGLKKEMQLGLKNSKQVLGESDPDPPGTMRDAGATAM